MPLLLVIWNAPLLVVVHDLYIVRPVIAPAEADTPSGIDPDAVLAISVSAKRFKTVAPQSGQITQVIGVVEYRQTTRCLVGERQEVCDADAFEEPSRVLVLETLDHSPRP